MTAGDGTDTIVTGDWITGEDDAAQLMDFDRTEDQLVVLYDIIEHPNPEVEIVTDPEMPGVSHVFVDGTEIAQVHGNGPITARDIVFVDHDDSAVFGLSA